MKWENGGCVGGSCRSACGDDSYLGDLFTLGVLKVSAWTLIERHDAMNILVTVRVIGEAASAFELVTTDVNCAVELLALPLEAAEACITESVTVAVVPVVRTEVTVDGPADVVDEIDNVAVTRQSDSQLKTESGDVSPTVFKTTPVPQDPVDPQNAELPPA